MTCWRPLAALGLALLMGGCAGGFFGAAPQATAAAEDSTAQVAAVAASGAAAASAAAASAPRASVQVSIDAPAPLKALLERHLDLVRLGQMDREDVDESEWGRLIAAAPAQVRSLLQTEGYFAPKLTLERGHGVGPSIEGGNRVNLHIEPGPPARISRVTLQVQGEMASESEAREGHARQVLTRWRSDWQMPAGSAFKNTTWSDAKAAALAQLRAAGYATANWAGTAADVDVQNHQVRLFLVADSGPLFRYGKLQIEGLTLQDANTVENLLAVQPGAPLTETVLLDFQDRLQRSGLFEGVTVALDNDPASAGNASVQVRAVEAPLQIYTFGAGISANNGPRASVEHLYRRVLGYPASSRVKIELGQKRQAGDAELSTHPLAGLSRYLVGGAVERLVSDDDVVLSQRLRLGRTQDKSSLERLHFLEFERSLRTLTESTERTNSIAVSANFHGAWRDLDSVVLPTRGVSLAVQVGAGRSHSTGADDGNFVRAYGRLTGYLPLAQSLYGHARVELGQAFARGSVAVPESQKWRAGGDDSVRGYAYRSLGPLQDGVVGSGKAVLTVSAEVARPFWANMPSLWGALFADAGGAADKLQDIEPVTGVGVGLRWRSPVGPLRLDYAWAPKVRQGRWHFTVGIAF